MDISIAQILKDVIGDNLTMEDIHGLAEQGIVASEKSIEKFLTGLEGYDKYEIESEDLLEKINGSIEKMHASEKDINLEKLKSLFDELDATIDGNEKLTEANASRAFYEALSELYILKVQTMEIIENLPDTKKEWLESINGLKNAKVGFEELVGYADSEDAEIDVAIKMYYDLLHKIDDLM